MAELLGNRDASSDDDFYELLGCNENSTAEQIATEFKQLARKYHPDKEHDQEQKDKAERMFVRLETARAVLLDSRQRTLYDQWRRGGFNHVFSFSHWQGLQARLHPSMHWAPPQPRAPSLPQPESAPSTTSHDVQTQSSDNKTPKLDSSGDSEKVSALEEFRKGGN